MKMQAIQGYPSAASRSLFHLHRWQGLQHKTQLKTNCLTDAVDMHFISMYYLIQQEIYLVVARSKVGDIYSNN
jgi:hypothetical protein